MSNIVKQVIVVRTKYPNNKGGFFKPRSGKLISQAAHASMAAILNQMSRHLNSSFEIYELPMRLESPLHQWITGRFTKIVVGCKSEEELLELQAKAEEAGIINALITDAGLTEFHGVPTKTCLAIGPDMPDKIDAITGHLKLL